MKRIKAFEWVVIRVKGEARVAEKELARIKQLLTFTQGVSDLKTTQAAMGLHHFLTILIMLMVSGLVAGVSLSQWPLSVNAAPPAQEDNDTVAAGDVEDDVVNEANEADEADASPDQTGITADEARAAAETANPGTKSLEVELKNENGTLVYEVELDNGLEVMVDAANGNILGTERDEAD
jgi:hypothetical protein